MLTLDIEVELGRACVVCGRDLPGEGEHRAVSVKSVVSQAGDSHYFDMLVPWAHGGCLN